MPPPFQPISAAFPAKPAILAGIKCPSACQLRQNVRMHPRKRLSAALLLALMAVMSSLHAADSAIVIDTAERFIRQQTSGQAGQVSIRMGKLDLDRLPPCEAHEAYSPPGTRFVGKTYIGVRCLAPNPWSVLVPSHISITTDYVTSSRPLRAGHTVGPDDLRLLTGDLANLPTGVVVDPQAALGKTLRNSVGTGQPLRSDQLLAPLLVRQGQTVRVISQGTGFSASAEGRALNNAAEGQLAQVRMNSGQTVSGIVRADGSVEISF